MKTVVITGSTRGLGIGLAEAFLAAGCAVVVNGRTPARVEEAVAALAQDALRARILGVAADVGNADDIQRLWDAACAQFGRVDIWINNAGIDNRRAPLWELDPADIRRVIDTNVTGALVACSIVLRGMAAQGGGAIYNMEGLGSQGRSAPGLLPYSTSKAATAHLTRALVDEAVDLPVIIGALNPGMVLTDMLLEDIPPDRRANARRIFNILADEVEVVAPWLVARILANQKSGVRFCWLTRRKILLRFGMAPFRKRNVLEQYEGRGKAN